MNLKLVVSILLLLSIGLLTIGCSKKPTPYQQDNIDRKAARKASTEKEQMALLYRNYGLIRYMNNVNDNVKMYVINKVTIYGKESKSEFNGLCNSFDISNSSEAIQLAAVNKNPEVINFINNPSDKVQMTAIRKDPTLIKHLENPSEKLQLVTINSMKISDKESEWQFYQMCDSLDISNSSEIIQLAAINKLPEVFTNIKNPSKKLQLAAIKKNANTLKYINNPSEDIQIIAIKNNCSDYIDILNAEKENSPRFNYTMGRAFNKDGCIINPKLSIYWYDKAANQGYPDAQYALAVIYSKGDGVAIDYLKAAHLFEEAAKDNILGAHINACYMYEDAKAYTEAFQCYQEETSNRTEALNNLGTCYATGKGVKLNKPKAYQYYLQAVKEGSVEAQQNLDLLCKKSSWACK